MKKSIVLLVLALSGCFHKTPPKPMRYFAFLGQYVFVCSEMKVAGCGPTLKKCVILPFAEAVPDIQCASNFQTIADDDGQKQ